ncbi:MAG: septum formation initiator family protein [Hespellia sp.]|nr:septum formation initiator family protein [Hespellia sp.]
MSKKRRRDLSRRPKKHVRCHRRSMMGISAVLLLLTLVIFCNCVSLQAKNRSYKAQETEIQNQLAEEEKRTEEIADFKEYVKTDDYVKEVARERLGLVDPNEIIFKPAE